MKRTRRRIDREIRNIRGSRAEGGKTLVQIICEHGINQSRFPGGEMNWRNTQAAISIPIAKPKKAKAKEANFAPHRLYNP
jgi:hypothetical protein